PYAARLHPYLSQKNNDGTYTDGTHTFKKISGPAWLAVAANGDISGTPGAADAGLNTFTIRAASTITRRSSDVSIDIPVFLPGQENVPRLSVMSYNIWHQMGMVHNGRRKGIESIARSGADIIGLQESSTSNANCLADELGWHRAIGPNDTQIISRYPVSEDSHGAVHIKARIHLSGNPRHDVIVYNCHLHYQSYAPYDGPGRTVEELLQKDANSRRLPEIRTILADMSASLAKADDTPVIFTGDFNCPSHLDWTAAAAHLHYDIGPVVWPTSKAVTDAGMLDSYRVAHPDPVASPGNTWSPIYIMPRTENDRIDFIYYKGSGLKVLSSEVFPGGEVQGVRYRHYTNIWPSDHAAVISVFSLDSVDSDK
ncbi:MAG TPA: endonuclease/exonuclease/phosphatase family protein, partial [Planctomicrobium sp.]|nr:endonuclease/exonuclease/phosphatase family protein [Planctomicrobium sp.]